MSFIFMNSTAQNKTREIIVTRNDTVIKCRVLNEKKKYSTHSDRMYYWYKAQEVYKNLGGYDGLLLSDYYSMYYDNKLIEKGKFKDGLKQGEWKEWYLNGDLKQIESFKNGLKNGKSYYYSEQKLYMLKSYKKGKLHGKTYIYKNDTVEIMTFRNGIKDIPKEKSELKNSKNATRDDLENEEIK
ncbi:MAG: hypothetical protein JXR48_01910 [Candidatus Delongbacteria bacterium]|nr:hypothetical protein [Candidatus Delongbacteria bacterium]